MNEGKTERGTLWGDDEVFTLIEIWADEGIQQQLDSCTRKRPVFETIARRLGEEGEYTRTFIQVREKIKQLKQAYKKGKDSNNRSGSNRKTFKYFESIDKILGDRPITRPVSILESNADEELESHTIESSSLEDDSVTAAESPPTPGSSKSDSPSVVNDYVLDLSEGDASTSTPTPKEVGVTVQRKERALPYRRGSSKKKSRNEINLANVCEIIHKQQEVFDDCFFKMEEERHKREMEREEKRRQDEKQHDIMMMRMMAEMFATASSTVENFPVTNSRNQMYRGQSFFQAMQHHMPQQQHQNIYNTLSNSEEQKEDSIYSNNF